jgi:AcrR family transcriptional regulator
MPEGTGNSVTASDRLATVGPKASAQTAHGAAPGASASVPDVGPVRRRPVQRRSVERFERMLDACAQLLDEVGYDELTTSQVAKRAGVPIGTLYQFFDGKLALTRALARRNLDLFLDRLHTRFSEAKESITTWADAASVVVGEFVAMKREVPGFGAVDFGDARPGKHFLLDAEREVENNQLVAERLKQLAVDDLGLPDAPGLDRALLIAVEAADGVMRLAFRYGPDGDPDLIAEAEILLRGYLGARLP